MRKKTQKLSLAEFLRTCKVGPPPATRHRLEAPPVINPASELPEGVPLVTLPTGEEWRGHDTFGLLYDDGRFHFLKLPDSIIHYICMKATLTPNLPLVCKAFDRILKAKEGEKHPYIGPEVAKQHLEAEMMDRAYLKQAVKSLGRIYDEEKVATDRLWAGELVLTPEDPHYMSLFHYTLEVIRYRLKGRLSAPAIARVKVDGKTYTAPTGSATPSTWYRKTTPK